MMLQKCRYCERYFTTKNEVYCSKECFDKDANESVGWWKEIEKWGKK